MNWLLVVADKASFLKQKYLKMVNKQMEGEKWESAKLDLFDRLIQESLNFSHKYAEWYLYQAIAGGSDYIRGVIPVLHGDQRDKTQEVKDWLERGNGSIPSITTSAKDVIAMSDEWHREMASRAAEYKTHNVIAYLSDGFQLVSVPSEDAQAEGYHMGHCVGSYCRDIDAGNVEILSIRDANNRPHVTIEVMPKSNRFRQDRPATNYIEVGQIKGKENTAQPKYAKYVEESLDALMEQGLVTLDDDGWLDYKGFQEDDQISNSRIRNMVEKQSEPGIHNSAMFEIFELGRTPPDRNELWEYLETGDMDESIHGMFDSNDNYTFGDYAIKAYADYLDEEALEMLARGDIDQEEYDDFKKGRGVYDNPELEGLVQGVISNFAEDIDNLRAFVLDTHEDDVMWHYVNYNYSDNFAYYDHDDAADYYTYWKNVFEREALEKKRQEHKDRLTRVVNDFGVVIPENVYDEVMHRAQYLPMSATDEAWVSELLGIVDRKVKQQEESWRVAKRSNWLTRIS